MCELQGQLAKLQEQLRQLAIDDHVVVTQQTEGA